MAVFEMPLEELRLYRGTNPRPADFDLYWEQALGEMHDQDSRVELRPSGFNPPFAECFHLYFTGVGGARVHAQYLRPREHSGSCPAVLQFHGYTGDAGDWQDKLGYVGAGFCVAAMDVRGQGGLSEDSGAVRGNTQRGHIIRGLDDDKEKLFYRQVFLDTAQLARIVMSFQEVNEQRIAAMGRSQGGALSLACTALEPAVRKAAPVFPFLADYQRVWEMDLAEGAYAELKEYFRRFDPTHAREAEIFERLGYIDIQHLAPRIRAEVLMATSLMDQTCPPSSQFAVYNKITAPKEMVLYPDFVHEDLPGFSDRTFGFLCGLLSG